METITEQVLDLKERGYSFAQIGEKLSLSRTPTRTCNETFGVIINGCEWN